MVPDCDAIVLHGVILAHYVFPADILLVDPLADIVEVVDETVDVAGPVDPTHGEPTVDQDAVEVLIFLVISGSKDKTEKAFRICLSEAFTSFLL